MDNFLNGSIEGTALELMPGIGVRDIYVGLKCVFSDRIPVMKYEYAYRSGNMLVLINGKREKDVFDKEFSMEGRKEYDLRLLEELTIRRMEILRCGIPINWDYPLIDCGDQKIKQLLIPDAYEVLRKNQVNYFGNMLSWNGVDEGSVPELTVTWNPYKKPEDLSEVWSFQEEDGLEFLLDRSRSGEYPKHIIIENRIGYMFMPGIYYFGGWVREFPPARQSIWLPRPDMRKSAAAGYQTYTGNLSPSDFCIMYLAIGDENIEILKKMQKTLGAYSRLVEYGTEKTVVEMTKAELDALFDF